MATRRRDWALCYAGVVYTAPSTAKESHVSPPRIVPLAAAAVLPLPRPAPGPRYPPGPVVVRHDPGPPLRPGQRRRPPRPPARPEAQHRPPAPARVLPGEGGQGRCQAGRPAPGLRRHRLLRPPAGLGALLLARLPAGF